MVRHQRPHRRRSKLGNKFQAGRGLTLKKVPVSRFCQRNTFAVYRSGEFIGYATSKTNAIKEYTVEKRTGVEGFRREGSQKGTWGPLNKREQSLSPYQYGFGTVWATNQKEADKKAKKEADMLGLGYWVAQYKIQRSHGNIKGAKQTYGNIVKRMNKLHLTASEKKDIWGKDPDRP